VRLYSYVVARDYGFAPNPFYGTCTLATCKPLIRKKAAVGDWVIGTGAAGNGLTGHLVYAMKITETMTFDDYFADPRFQAKKPNIMGSLKQAFGDNIYHRGQAGDWLQLDSHHSLADGSPNPANVANDTQTNRLLLSDHFGYFGANAPAIPMNVRISGTNDLRAGRGYKNNFDPDFVEWFVGWFEQLDRIGADGRPREWLRRGALRKGS
jgi:Nucleotide modification associated domain 2